MTSLSNRNLDNDLPVVVIGSGPAGASAAAKLVERGVAVTMLDSGDGAPRGLIVRAAGNTMFRRMGYSAYSTDRLSPDSTGVEWTSSLSHGGLSNFWTAAVPRFAPDDFTEGGRLDHRYVWPVSYDDLQPYYDQVDHALTVTAADPIPGVPPNVVRHRHRIPADWERVVRRARDNGDGFGALPMAKGDPWMIATRGTEFSSYHCLVEPLLSQPNFTLRSGAHVSRVVCSPQTGRAEIVEYQDRASGELVTLRCCAVVVAAGTVDTTMILLRSTTPESQTGLGNSRDLIGRYLHDHPREWWSALTQRPMRALAHPLYLARAGYDDSDPLMATSHTIGLVAPRERLKTYVRGSTRSLGVQVFGTMVPLPEIGVSLGADARPESSVPVVSQRPILSLTYDERTVANVETSRERFRHVLGDAGLDVSVPGPFHPLTPGSSVHLAGTVRMHDDPEFGVLDRWNRMHEVDNVVVCDLSCFTTGPEKNPTPTAMALALRAADRLADDLMGADAA